MLDYDWSCACCAQTHTHTYMHACMHAYIHPLEITCCEGGLPLALARRNVVSRMVEVLQMKYGAVRVEMQQLGEKDSAR